MPLGYEVFAGNRNDVTTVEEIVTTMESRYGKADRIWVMDRGMVSQANVEFLKGGGRKYILGTRKSMLRKFEREIADGNWQTVREGVEVELCPSPGGEEVFILCRSADRREKEKAMPAGPHLRRSRPSGTSGSRRGSKRA
jgi:transposase